MTDINNWYAEAYAAYMRASYGQRQNPRDTVYKGVLSQLTKIPGFLTDPGHAPTWLDLGCGIGDTSALVQNVLQESRGDHAARMYGMELLPEHVARTQSRIAGSTVHQGDVFNQADFRAALGMQEEPSVVVLSHVAYYGAKKANDSQKPLEGLVDAVVKTMGKRSLGVFTHIVQEDIDPLKEKYADVVESNAGNALRKLCREKGYAVHSLRFPIVMDMPPVSDGFWAKLREGKPYGNGENPYPDEPNGLEMRRILEFFIHTKLEDMSPEARNDYVSGIQSLLAEHHNTLSRQTEMLFVTPPGADKSFQAAVTNAMNRAKSELRVQGLISSIEIF